MSADASMCAIAFGYDWAMGCHRSGDVGTGVFVCPLLEKEVKGGR
jgi:hypothetical protein